MFLASNGDQYSVCILRNNRLHCFDNNNFVIEKGQLQQAFFNELVLLVLAMLFAIFQTYFAVATQTVVLSALIELQLGNMIDCYNV